MDGALAYGLSRPEDAGTRRRVLLIDPATLTRECLSHMLRRRGTRFALDSVAAAAEAPAAHPDAVLLNIHAACVDDAGVLRQIAEIRAQFVGAPIVIIAERDDSVLAITAIRLQLRGYLPTSLSADMLAAAVGVVLAGGTFVPGRLIAECAVLPVAPSRPTAVAADRFGLTRRERDVLALLRLGKPNKLIAYELAISEATVKVHVRSIMTKLHATNRTQLAILGTAAAPRIERSAA